MRIYFSLNNLIEFINTTEHLYQNPNDQGIGFDQIKNLVKRSAERYLCFSKNELIRLQDEDPKSFSNIDRWLKTEFSQNQHENAETNFRCNNEKFKYYSTKLNHMSREQIMSVYLLSDNENLQSLSSKNSLIVCEKLGDEYETLEKLFIKKNNSLGYNLPNNWKENRNDGIKIYWESRFEHINYLTDIMIIDPWIFEKEPSTSMKTNQDNIIQVLSVLISKTKSSPINIVIRTADPSNHRDDTENYNYLKENLNNLHTDQEINITIIGDWRGDHCRELITNYDGYHSGKGFSLFNNRKEYQDKRLRQFKEKLTEFEVYKEKVEIFDETTKKLTGNYINFRVTGDKKSNFIKF